MELNLFYNSVKCMVSNNILSNKKEKTHKFLERNLTIHMFVDKH